MSDKRLGAALFIFWCTMMAIDAGRAINSYTLDSFYGTRAANLCFFMAMDVFLLSHHFDDFVRWAKNKD
jgi:hypothetical protein